MLFKITDKPLYEENPSLNAVPEFREKSERMLRYVFLVYDFDSPYRKIPLEKRKEKCVILAGYKYESDGKRLDKNARDIISGNNVTVNTIINAFMGLQDNTEKAMLAALDEQLYEWIELMKKKNKSIKESDLVLKISKELPGFMRRKQELEDIVDGRVGDESPEESKPMSTLDEVNSMNQE